jgi:hypothetical protein
MFVTIDYRIAQWLSRRGSIVSVLAVTDDNGRRYSLETVDPPASGSRVDVAPCDLVEMDHRHLIDGTV